MNSLGIEYGASSSDEEVMTSPLVSHTKPTVAPSPAAQTAEGSAFLVPDKTDGTCVVQPSDNTTKQELESTTMTAEGTGGTLTDNDLEEMLLQAGIPAAADPLAADNATQQRIERFLRVQRERGQDFQTTLQEKKEVRNPYILEKVVEYFGINELHSNFAKDQFDPFGLPLHEYADVLAVEQKKRMDARAQRQV
ncbi:unnamed protein product [Hyaloperonospora brassicae]|uniref:Uncharacterized protein n=1 Tax=Hyaloperonospora brassicae TaxID=162125 RepID=A0AAV0TS07_HYABA|nr:unnamed protein product [Hyaloperonospora brassicae]